MGAAGRALVAIGLLALTAWGSVRHGRDPCPGPGEGRVDARLLRVHRQHKQPGLPAESMPRLQMTRLAVATCAVVLTACGSVHPVGSASARSTDSVTTTDEPSRAVWVARTGSVPWVPLPAAHQTVEAPPAVPVPPIPIPVGTPTCRADQMEGVGLAAGIAAGNIDMP